MLIELKEQPCIQCIVSLWMYVCVCLCLWIGTITSNVLIQAQYSIHGAYTLTISSALWKTYSGAHSNFTGRQYSRTDLSIYRSTCLFIQQSLSITLPFFCLSASIRLSLSDKKCNTYFLSLADKVLHNTREQTTGAPTRHTPTRFSAKTHLSYTIISFLVIFPVYRLKHISMQASFV